DYEGSGYGLLPCKTRSNDGQAGTGKWANQARRLSQKALSVAALAESPGHTLAQRGLVPRLTRVAQSPPSARTRSACAPAGSGRRIHWTLVQAAKRSRRR